MASINIRQHFAVSKEIVFAEITPHKMLSEVLPVSIAITKKGKSEASGLHSIRAIGLGFIKPLKEQVTYFEPSNCVEYKIIGLFEKVIVHHQGVLTFTEDKNNPQHTVLNWHVELDLIPRFMSSMVLGILKKTIAIGLAKKAKMINV